MKKLSDYIGQKIAINCKTDEEIRAILKLNNSVLNANILFDCLKSKGDNYKFCYNLSTDGYGDENYYIDNGYTILPATYFLEEEFIYGEEYEFYSNNTNRFKEKYLCKTPDGKFVSYDGATISLWDYCRKINTERTEAITTAKELITKFDIKQEELY